MRKSTKLMAGLGVVAGLGVALAPLATFATPLGVDTLTVTVNSSCELKTGLDDTSTPGTTEDNAPFANHYYGTLSAGGYVVLDETHLVQSGTGTTQDPYVVGTGSKTTINITCNDAYPSGTSISDETTGHGWSIKAVGTALAGATTGASIPVANPDNGTTSGWGVMLSESDNGGDTTIVSTYDTVYTALPEETAGVVAYGSRAAANAGFTIDSYKVSAAANQAADTYTGTATYTFFVPQS